MVQKEGTDIVVMPDLEIMSGAGETMKVYVQDRVMVPVTVGEEQVVAAASWAAFVGGWVM